MVAIHDARTLGCPPLGFYNIVAQTEAERWEATRDEREARAREFKASVLEQYKQRGLEPPPELRQNDA
jgi:hypothetical protein